MPGVISSVCNTNVHLSKSSGNVEFTLHYSTFAETEKRMPFNMNLRLSW